MAELTRSKDGHKSGAIHGFLNGFSWVCKDLDIPQNAATVFWDGGRAAWRKELYPAYKEGRVFHTKEGVDAERDRREYHNQLGAIQQALKFIGVPQSRTEGCEADDLIGIYASEAGRQGHTAIIFSGDADFHQLATDKIFILKPTTKKEDKPMSERDILAWYGFDSIVQVLLYKVLTGDQSDNIGKIAGIGDVTAKKIIKEVWGKERNQVPEKLQKWWDAIRANANLLDRNYKLMRLPTRWSEAGYTEQQRLDTEAQLHIKGDDVSRTKFIQLLMAWELNFLLDRVERF